MEFELFAEDDYAFEAEYIDNEQLAFEGQKCGICMDVVVDRGVLDCCQHWYCFSCIDNWASITNLCPLCQNEFQIITCVPVYDTIGSIQPDGPDDGSDSRDDEDWSVEGNNNTLSFPSYYIDENTTSKSVKLIEISRLMLVRPEMCHFLDVLTKKRFLTSVSCLDGDNCKIRGQSANVEEGADLDTSIACDSCDLWYHAICVGFDPDGSCENSWLCPRCLVNENETLQKSELVPIHDHGLESSSRGHLGDANFPMNVSVSVADAGETAVVVSIINENQQNNVENKSNVNTSKDLKIEIQGNEEINQIIFPASDVCEDNRELENQLAEKVIMKPKIEVVEQDHCLSQLSSRNLRDETSEPSVSESDGLRASELYDEHSNNKILESCFPLISSVDLLSDKNEILGEVEGKKVSKGRRLQAEKNPDKKEKAGGVTDAKRKQRDYSAEEGETKTKMQNSTTPEIFKIERRSRVTHSINKTNSTVLNDSKNSNRTIVRKRKVETDIRDIVQGIHHRPSKRLAPEETATGLRIKKIMRRSTDNKESLAEVQNLRKEIRDAIRNRSSKEVGDNLFDPKLLAAFRTALTGQTTETNRPPPLDVKAKKALLQKGTVRENLTKKIYGIGGKRKRAWTRDCEIEFWKHRCSKISKPEKIETLKSVLDLLRKGPEVKEIKKEDTVEARSSILSRLYVADTSVFPRKDDIKPLSLQSADSSVDSKETKVAAIPLVSGEPATRKVNPSKSSDQSSRSKGVVPMNDQKESGSGSNDIKLDKKKWALEVLARKTAVSGNKSSQGQDNAGLKGNYPLLAKLPVDMRPSLAPSRHNKIPVSVRQAQLHRLTEHFLRKTNKPVTRPTAEIELAVADAINVEKAVADKSNSKLVYINLCSQELLHRADNVDSTTKPNSEPTTNPNSEPTTNPNSEPTANPNSEPTSDLNNATVDLPACADVDEALRSAGLLSDSPPDSPKEEDGPDNVFEIDCQPELDIYGDFEYDLEDENDFIGANAIKTSTVQQEDTKIKMVFSTLDFNKSGSDWRFEDHEAPVVMENVNEDNTKEKSSPTEGGEDEIFGECEELYGPDKEPLISKYPDITPPDLITENNVARVQNEQGSIPNGNCSEKLAVSDIVNHSSCGKELPKKPLETVEGKEKKPHPDKKKQPDNRNSVFKKVEAYIKEHIRPLCKSGVITVEQYRWAVGKTTDKIMKYHSKDTNANFLIKEGEKVKKLAEQYVESAQTVESKK